jgi:hypothetical protein
VGFAPLVAPILISGTGAARLHVPPALGCESPAARGSILTYWGHVLLSPVTVPTGAPARLAAEVKQKAFEERNAAYDRMCLHKKTCPVCNPKLKATYSSRERRPGMP